MQDTTKPKRDARGRLLPGSPPNNPKGRPPALPAEVRQRLDNLAEEAVEVVRRTLRSEDEKLAFAAAQEILNRAYGRPVMQAKLDVTANGPASHLAAMIAMTQKATPVIGLLAEQDEPKVIDVTPVEKAP